jgi:ribose-phosphate pyrophosphokinase
MFKLFTGSSNPQLTQEVANLLKITVSKAEIIRFDDSEVKVTIQEQVKDEICVILQSTSNPTDTNLMELFFFADALKRVEAKKIIAFIPYFGYARQNREHRAGESVSVNVVIRFLETVGFNEVYTFDIHDEGTEGIFSIPFKSLSTLPFLADKIKNYLAPTEVVSIVSPDQGGVERARIFASAYFKNSQEEIIVIEKKRDLNIAHQSETLDLYGNVAEKTCILVDDIITSGKTLINAADLCLKKGAKKVIAAIVHHDFSSSSLKRLEQSSIEKIFTTNTILLKKEQQFPKLQEISVSKLIANELRTL